MSSIIEDLSSQITGTNKTFNTENSLHDGLFLALNGVSFSEVDYTINTNFQFTLNEAPSIGDELIFFVSPIIYDISDQIDGVTRQFHKDPEDATTGMQFLSIYNGITYFTVEIDGSNFSLGFTPELGGELLYMRGIFVRNGPDKSFSVIGQIKKNDINGNVFKNTIKGEIA